MTFNTYHDPDLAVCPFCGTIEDRVNQGRNHWFVCHTHRLAWYVGANLFSDWRSETFAYQQMRVRQIEAYRLIADRFDDGHSYSLTA